MTLPNDVEHWSFTTLREKPIKIVCLGGQLLTQHTGGEVESYGLAEPYKDGVAIRMAGHRVSLAPGGMIRVCESPEGRRPLPPALVLPAGSGTVDQAVEVQIRQIGERPVGVGDQDRGSAL